MSEAEEWRAVSGYTQYEVSSLGRLRSWKRLDPVQPEPRILKLDGSSRYLTINLVGPGRRRCSVHRLVLEAFVGPRPVGMEACHNNGDRRDNRLQNLRWGTSKENGRDKVKHGASPVGERNGKAKLTEEDVRMARSARMTSSDVMRRWGLSRQGAIAMLRGRTWRHVA